MPRTHNNTGRARKRSGDIRVAPPTNTTRPYFNKRIKVQFRARTVEMLESPAFRVLSLSGHRLLARLEIELSHHGGRHNGNLPCTYDDFVEYGIHRHAIGPAIRECEALGFIRVTEPGRAGNAEYRLPNKFMITYQPSDGAVATDDWKRITTMEQAQEAFRMARTVRRKNRTPVSKSAPHHSAVTGTTSSAVIDTGVHSALTVTTFDTVSLRGSDGGRTRGS